MRRAIRTEQKVRLFRACLAGLVFCASTALIETAGTGIAFGAVGTAPYTIGTPTNAVSAVSASPANAVQGLATPFSVKFLATSPMAGSQSASVTIGASVPLGSVPSAISLIDDTHTNCFQSGTNGGQASTSSLTVILVTSCDIPAGDMVEVDFTADAPGGTGSVYFTLSTSANGAPASSNPVSVGQSPPTYSAGAAMLGANTTYTISGASWPVPSVPGAFNALVLQSEPGTAAAITWYAGTGGYQVSFVAPGAATISDPVTGVAVSQSSAPADTVTLFLTSSLAAGDDISVVGRGTNPPAAGTNGVSVTPAFGAPGSAQPVGPAEVATNDVLFGTSVTSAQVSVSPPVASAAATYTVGFQAATALAGGPGAEICLDEQTGPTVFSTEGGVLVSDTTAGWHFVVTSAVFPSGASKADQGCGSPENGVVLQLASGNEIRAGDWVVLTLAGVTNPSAGLIEDFSVATSSDSVPADAPPYSIGPSASPGVAVSVNPSTAGSLATYTISDLVATAPLDAGSSTITIEGPIGTVFPDNPGYFTISDSDTPSGSGGTVAPLSGGATNDVTITVPQTIHSGDHLTITVEDVVNPASAGSGYSLTLLGSVSGPVAVPAFPQANITFPNGAIVSFGGTYYVFAGGRGFGIPSVSALAALRRADRTTILSSPGTAAPPEVPVRPGTLLCTRAVTGSTTIYVEGADGELHGFATSAQFIADGYSSSLVVSVPSLGGFQVGRTAGSLGSAVNALSTRADGAVLRSRGAFFVLGGGRAFGVASPAQLRALRRVDRGIPIAGPLPAETLTNHPVDGVLVSTGGVVYVSYQGELWPFKSERQLLADGYGGSAAITVPSTDRLQVMAGYSGS